MTNSREMAIEGDMKGERVDPGVFADGSAAITALMHFSSIDQHVYRLYIAVSQSMSKQLPAGVDGAYFNNVRCDSHVVEPCQSHTKVNRFPCVPLWIPAFICMYIPAFLNTILLLIPPPAHHQSFTHQITFQVCHRVKHTNTQRHTHRHTEQ